MKTWTITYCFNYEHEGEPAGTLFAGSGYGATKEDAVADFRFWHNAPDMKIVSVEEYK